MNTNQIREGFLSFFKDKGHKIFPSDSLVPKDPTLLFTSAGMNQFKDYFLGIKNDVKRAASCQKCLRTADLEKVGKTPYHHTFFEMLGNFSFGDYFKEEAILWAWEFLTAVLKLKEERLWVSVYKDDEEAYLIWRDKIKLPGNKIFKFGAKENFWPSDAPLNGPNGPCGPCSEIFFDWGETVGCKKPTCNPSCDCGRFIEIWNLVFTQFNRTGPNKLEPLPTKNIDTGMGLERISSVIQGKPTNFEIDIIRPLLDEISFILKTQEQFLIRAVADHLRAAVFAISDGVYPSNQEKGYVVRRILRRALWFAFSVGRKEPFLYSLVSRVGELMEEPYPEVFQKREVISSVILAEEEKFLSNLERGKELLFSHIDEALKKAQEEIPSSVVFKLYDTYGFPLELTSFILKEKSLRFNEEEVKSLLEKQKESSRLASKFDGLIFVGEKLPFTYPTEFIGYDNESCPVVIKGIIKNGKVFKSWGFLEEEVALILDKTVFYPTGGGQLSDRGFIKGREESFIFEVEGVDKVGDTILHIGFLKSGVIREDDVAFAYIDVERRKALARAHTSTHLLQAALRKILGEHVQQQGSLVDEDYLKFDFSHFKGLSSEDLLRVEEEVNYYIAKSSPVKPYHLSFSEAKEKGVLAFFEEKYQDLVRVVEVEGISRELCGGTHLKNTSEALVFVIISESSVSSGIRRIEALVGKKAYRFLSEKKESLKRISSLLKTTEDNLEKNLKDLISANKNFNKEIYSLRRRVFKDIEAEGLLKNPYLFGEVKLIVFEFEYKDNQLLRECLDILKARAKEKSLFLGFIQDGDRFTLNVGLTPDLVNKGLSSREICLKITQKLGGWAGGRDDFASGGAKIKERMSLERLKELTLSILE